MDRPIAEPIPEALRRAGARPLAEALLVVHPTAVPVEARIALEAAGVAAVAVPTVVEDPVAAEGVAVALTAEVDRVAVAAPTNKLIERCRSNFSRTPFDFAVACPRIEARLRGRQPLRSSRATRLLNPLPRGYPAYASLGL